MRVIKMQNGENDFVGGLVFHKRVKRVLDEMSPDKQLLIDLNNLYLDSSVIGTLLAIFTTCKKKEIEMGVTNVSDETRNVLRITGVINILKIVDGNQESK